MINLNSIKYNPNVTFGVDNFTCCLNKIVHAKSNIVALLNRILDFLCQNVNAYIFVATTGRSGSDSLSRIFDVVEDAVCYHEPYPIMFNDYPKGTNRKDYFEKIFFRIKRINIKRAAIGKKCYVETNHQFVKNFISYAIKSFENKIKIIHLVRDPVRVATSFYAINSIPGKTKRGKYYLIDPEDPENLIKLPELYNGDQNYKHDYYKCLWYWYEIEAKILRNKNKYQNIIWYTLNTNDLNIKNEIIKMLKKFNLAFDYKKLESLIGIRANPKVSEKVNKIDNIDCELMHKKLINLIKIHYGENFINTIYV